MARTTRKDRDDAREAATTATAQHGQIASVGATAAPPDVAVGPSHFATSTAARRLAQQQAYDDMHVKGSDTAPAPGSSCVDAPTRPQWQKVLWLRQPYPDDYVDPSFLRELVVNARVPSRRYAAVVIDAVSVSRQLSLVAAVALVVVALIHGKLTPARLLALDLGLLMAGYAVCAALGGLARGAWVVQGRAARQAGLLVGGVYFLAPTLRTLAATVSADSVVALAVAAAGAHLLLHDYDYVNTVSQKLTGTVALAAAMLGAVLLSSLLPTEQHVFAEVLFAFELFLLSPFLWRLVRRASLAAHLAAAALLAAVTCVACWRIAGGVAGAALAAAHCGLTAACPAVLIRIHKFKANINGPWDEAVPHLPLPQTYPLVQGQQKRL